MTSALLAVALLSATAARASLSQADLATVGSTPPAGARLPALDFADQNGRPYRLRPATTPTILLFADYSCRHICGPGVTLTAGALHDAGLRPGRDYRMVVLGLDQDGPARARALAQKQLAGLPDEARAITLLTSAPATVAAAERALGYHAVYDPAADQFAHDAAIYVFAPDGRLSGLLPEIAAAPPQLAAAVAAARAGNSRAVPQTLGAHIAALCYGLATAHGPYARAIVAALRIGGVVICATLAGFLLWSLRRARRVA